MREPPRTILAIIADLQIGGTTALAPLRYDIQTRDMKEKQTVEANLLQRWLYDKWIDYWTYVREKVAKKHKLVTVILGELIEGNHHGSAQLVQEIPDQLAMAQQLLEPVCNFSNSVYATLATDAHAGRHGTDEATFYRTMGIDYDYRLWLEVDGILHDFAHHGRVGRRPWTSAAAGYATEVVIDAATQNAPIPNYVWRGHNHLIDDSGFKIPGTRCICLPSWQLKTSFGHRVASSQSRSDIGGIVFDREPDFTKARYMGQPDNRKVIKV